MGHRSQPAAALNYSAALRPKSLERQAEHSPPRPRRQAPSGGKEYDRAIEDLIRAIARDAGIADRISALAAYPSLSRLSSRNCRR